MNKCDKCGFLHYRTDPCREPKPARFTAPPKPKLGRPRLHLDRRAYKTKWQREKRQEMAEIKSGIRKPTPRVKK